MSNEQHTRKTIIDKKLLRAGWDVNDRTQVVEEFTISGKIYVAEEPEANYSSSQFSDYVLLGRNGKPLAVVEAKKSAIDAEIGREQAKQYCLAIEKEGNELPFCFYTNGHDIFFWDLRNYAPKKVFAFPTLDDLERYQHLRQSRKPLAEELINTQIAGRDYQINAIRTVMEAIEKRKRKFLLVMATGTGKTRTSIALIEALMRGGWVERVLFLVDRIALKEQALEAFKEHLPNEPRWPKRNETEITADRRIYVNTYPSMLNSIREEKDALSPHFFDLVIIDESHRSIYNTYGEILEYFNTIILGLTATPTDVIDHNTFQLFEHEDGLPAFAYSYEEAVNNLPPYLCNFEVMKISTHFQEEGISKRTISLKDQKRLMLEGKEVAEINYEGTELEKKVVNRGTNALIIKEFMKESIKDANGVIPGKSIFFCMTKAHARRIEVLFDELYPEYKGELAKVMVSEDARVHGKGGLLDQFKNRDMPRVAISVDMLDTGIDVRELVNLVFAKPVYSYTKFWQMIGRGTRLLDNTKKKSWCRKKNTFLILDCWDNFDYFKLNPKGKETKAAIAVPVRLFALRLDKLFLAKALEETEIAENEIKELRALIAQLPKNSVIIMDAQSELKQVESNSFWEALSEEKQSFLRNQIQPLFRTLNDVDFKALRLEKDVVELSIARLAGNEERYEKLSENLRLKIGELPLSVNVVAQEQELIEKTQQSYFWSKADENTFTTLIDRLVPLMKYIENSEPSDKPEQFNFRDKIAKKEKVKFGPEHESISISKYKAMVEERVLNLTQSNPILQKVQEGGPLSDEEIETLGETLYKERPHITLQLLRKVYRHQKAELLAFLRHILKVELLEAYPETLAKLFDAFIAEHSNLSSRQLEFLKVLKVFLLERRNIQKRHLIESPFTRIHPDGIRGIFNPKEIDEILTLIEEAA